MLVADLYLINNCHARFRMRCSSFETHRKTVFSKPGKPEIRVLSDRTKIARIKFRHHVWICINGVVYRGGKGVRTPGAIHMTRFYYSNVISLVLLRMCYAERKYVST